MITDFGGWPGLASADKASRSAIGVSQEIPAAVRTFRLDHCFPRFTGLPYHKFAGLLPFFRLAILQEKRRWEVSHRLVLTFGEPIDISGGLVPKLSHGFDSLRKLVRQVA